MKTRTTQWVSLALCMLGGLFSLAVFRDLPELVPTHWNALGVPDRYGSRQFGALALPATATAIWLLFWLLPKIAPTGWRMEPFLPIWNRCQIAIVAFVLALHVLLLGSALGWWLAESVPRGVIAMVGGLLIFLGNYLGKTTRNFFMGIRTPWTLASDEVWRRTHRLGGWLFVAAGVVLVGMGVVGVNVALLLAVLVIAAAVPVVYSYIAYRKLEGFRAPPAE
jgi:uncharacterized membrane protein